MDAVQDALEEVVGSVTHERETHEYGTTHPAEDLQHAGVINDTASHAIRHQFSKDGEELAKADYIEFTLLVEKALPSRKPRQRLSRVGMNQPAEPYGKHLTPRHP